MLLHLGGIINHKTGFLEVCVLFSICLRLGLNFPLRPVTLCSRMDAYSLQDKMLTLDNKQQQEEKLIYLLNLTNHEKQEA